MSTLLTIQHPGKMISMTASAISPPQCPCACWACLHAHTPLTPRRPNRLCFAALGAPPADRGLIRRPPAHLAVLRVGRADEGIALAAKHQVQSEKQRGGARVVQLGALPVGHPELELAGRAALVVPVLPHLLGGCLVALRMPGMIAGAHAPKDPA